MLLGNCFTAGALPEQQLLVACGVAPRGKLAVVRSGCGLLPAMLDGPELPVSTQRSSTACSGQAPLYFLAGFVSSCRFLALLLKPQPTQHQQQLACLLCLTVMLCAGLSVAG